MLLLNRTLIRLSRGLWGWIAAIVLVHFASMVGLTHFAILLAGYLGSLTEPGFDTANAAGALGAAALMTLLILIAQLLQGELEYRCTAKARTVLRRAIFSKVLELDVGNIERIGPVSAINASVDAVENMQSYYSVYLPSLIFSVIAPVYLFLRLRDTSLVIALILLLVSLLCLPLNNVFRGMIERLRGVYWRSLEDMTAYFLDSLRGLKTLKLFERDRDHRDTLSRKAEKLNRDIMAFMRVNFTSFLATEGLIYACILAALFLVCRGLRQGEAALGPALTVLMLSYSFFSSIRQLMSATHSALSAVAAAGKVEEILAVDTARAYDPSLPLQAEPYPGIRLENVDFSYAGRGRALSGVSIDVPRGGVTALVGLSGCGKSTAASLMMRFLDPQGGSLSLEGRDYRSMTPQELRRHIAMVPQSVSLFSGSIRDNLLLADGTADDGLLMEVLDKVSLGDFVRSLPLGLDTDVGDAGDRLSGGQKQKLGIARALLSRAEYIIFDEATSSVDVHSEEEIWHCIRDIAANRTLVIISHRLSTIAQADMIYVLEGGRVLEKGSHRELMENGSLYHRLVSEQAAQEATA